MAQQRQPVYLPGKANREFLHGYANHVDALMAIMESSYDGIYITNGEANTLYCNPSYTVISGLAGAEVLGKNMRELVRSGIMSHSGTLLALEKRIPVTIEQEFKTGKKAIVSSTPVFGEEGDVVMVVTNVRDQSELYSLREKLEEKDEAAQKYQTEIELMRQQILQESDMVTVDRRMLDVLNVVDRVAQMDTPVLLLGETGVGKERIAAYLYNKSGRRKQNFIKVNCGAIPETLIESELFGYEPGAFTGASKQGKIGFFGVANGGTIFLDEVGELTPAVQVRLLRVLAATNQNLEEMVRQGKFRQDLYYRLNVFPVVVPPLRERREDIPVLAQYMLQQLNRKYGKNKTLASTALAALKEYNWPGNVRELKNIMERAFIMSEEEPITAAVLPLHGAAPVAGPAPAGHYNLKELLERTEFAHIKEAYKTYGNVRDAAKNLGMDAATFTRKRKKYAEKYNGVDTAT